MHFHLKISIINFLRKTIQRNEKNISWYHDLVCNEYLNEIVENWHLSYIGYSNPWYAIYLLFMSSFIYHNNVLHISVWNVYISFVRYILRYLIFFSCSYNSFSNSFANFWLLVYENTIFVDLSRDLPS